MHPRSAIRSAVCASLVFLACAWPTPGVSGMATGSEASTAGTPGVDAPDLRSRYVEGVGGVPLNVIEAGQAGKPTIVFIHGLGQSHLSWEPQLRSALAREFHLVAYDLRGHGNSGKPWLAEDYEAPATWAGDLARVLKATQAERPLLVTWSYGTWVAVDFLKGHPPEALAGLVMIGGLGGLWVPEPATTQERSAEGERLSQMTASGWLGDNFAAGEGINRFFVRQPVDQVWSQRTAAVNAMLAPYVRPLILMRSFDNSGAMGRMGLPTWIVVGSLDVTLPIADAQALQHRLPDAQLTVFEGSGHLPFAEDPERFNQHLAAFAREALTGM